MHGHWLWAVPILLIVAVLALRQIDWYPATYDEFFSMMNSGWVIDKPYSPDDILDSLAQNSPNHTPLYFMLLNVWGHLVGNDVALGRVFTVLTALLALTAIYRLSSDFVAPVAGLFALVAVASNSFFNYYYAHVRMYPLLVLTSALCLWLYLRITYGQSHARLPTYLAFFGATLALVYTHAFSALMLLALGAYHVLIAPKNMRWFRTSLAVAAALALFSPWLMILATRGLAQTIDRWGQGQSTLREVLAAWLYVGFNGSRALAGLAAVAAVVGMLKKTIRIHHLSIMFFILALMLIAVVSDALRTDSMRLTLSTLPPLALFVAAGMYALYRLRTWLGLLVLVWILAGFSFQDSDLLNHYLGNRVRAFSLPAWHAVSRLALDSGQSMTIVGYGFRGQDLVFEVFRGRSQAHFYFSDNDIEFIHASSRQEFESTVRKLALNESNVWTFYRAGLVSSDHAAKIKSIMSALQYELCAADEVGF